MRILSKIIVFLLTLFCASVIVSYFFGFSITFPFSITEDFVVPDHRLHIIRLGTFSTFVYFGIRYLFFTNKKLYPIQFLGVLLFNFAVVGGLYFFVNDLSLKEFYLIPFFIIVSIILYNAAKPEFRNYFKTNKKII